MSLQETIESKLKKNLAPEYLEVIDESFGHQGHQAGGAHFKVVIVSKVFEGKGSLERHRMVHGILAEELKGEIHALSIQSCTIGEWRQK